VDGMKHDKKKRDAVIMRDYPLLRADLEKMLPDRSTPIILVKKNVCQLLERKLTDDGFKVANKGSVVYFPAFSRQPKFHEQFGSLNVVPPEVVAALLRDLRHGTHAAAWDDRVDGIGAML
jgi:hypothetical protein